MIKNTSNVYLHRLKFSQSGRMLCIKSPNFGTWRQYCRRLGQPPGHTFAGPRRSAAQGLVPLCHSDFFRTKPVGGGRQPDYLNAVVLTQAKLAPAALLRLIKGLERQAGRRPGRRLGPRPLDIDILDYGGRRLGWPGRGAAARGWFCPIRRRTGAPSCSCPWPRSRPGGATRCWAPARAPCSAAWAGRAGIRSSAIP